MRTNHTIKLLSLAMSALFVLGLNACGGGNAAPLGTSTTVPLTTSAPASVNIAVGQTSTFKISGGSGIGGTNFTSYTAVGSNGSIASVGMKDNNDWSVTGLAAGTVSVLLTDAGGNQKTVSIIVGTAPSSGGALYIAAPSQIVLGQQVSSDYAIAGGSAPYTVSVSNSSVINAALVGGKTLSVTGLAVGNAALEVFDAAGDSASIIVTVNNGGPGAALFTTAPASIVVGVGAAATYQVEGGTGPYTASSANTSLVKAGVAGNQLTISGIAAGATTEVDVLDQLGAKVAISVSTAGAGAVALYTTAPSSVTVASGAHATFTIGGGTAPYAVSSGAASIATVSVSGNQFVVTGIAAGTAQLQITDSNGTAVPVSVTVN